MELPKQPIPYEVLAKHVEELHKYSPIQLPSDKDLMGNCTTFAASLSTDLAAKYFPNGSHLAGQLPHRIQFSPHAHMNVITPPDRIQLSLGCVRHDFETLAALVDHVANPENGVVLATVDGAGHAFNVVRTDQGVKIADAQYGFICDLEDWENILKIASDNQGRYVGGHFGMMNIGEHDPMVSAHLRRLDEALAHYSTAPTIVEKIQSKAGEFYGDQRDFDSVVFAAVTDPDLVNSVQDFSSIGNRYTQDPEHAGASTAIDVNLIDIDLKPGDWIAARDENDQPIMYLKTNKGIVEMRLEPHRANLTDREIDEDLHILASSSSLDLRGFERTPYSIKRLNKEIETLDLTQLSERAAGFER